MKTAPRCRHIKTNGLTCKSPALRGEPRCFFHNRQMLRHARINAFSNPPGLASPGENLPLIPIEDSDSIQLALSMVINALAIGHLEPLRARALLYGLQIASVNTRNTCAEPSNRCDLALSTETDPVSEDLALSGALVDITDPAIAFQQEDEARRARRESAGDEDNEDNEDDEDDEDDDEDGYEEDDDDEDEYDDEEDEAGDDQAVDNEQDSADDIKVFRRLDAFMRRHP